MLLHNKRVAIIGGGPGGLTLARLLQQKEVDVKVYERDENKEVRVQGATLDLHFESGLRALEAAGLMDAFKAHYRPDNDRYRIVDQRAVIYHDDHATPSTAGFGDEWFRPEIDRGPLRHILLDSLQPGTVVWDSHIISLEKRGDGWKMGFKNGTMAQADIVIGADGANSKVRPLVTAIGPLYSGVTILEGAVKNAEKDAPKINSLLKGGKIMAFGGSKTLSVSIKGDGSLNFYLGFKAPADWAAKSGMDFKDGRQVLEWFKKEYTGWDDLWLELFEQETFYFVPRPQYCMPLDQYWEAQHNITLIGDAAHVMPPYAGEGVNMAMLDALQLSESLTGGGHTDVKQAIAHYEGLMFARFAEIGSETLENTEWMHGPDGLKTMVQMLNQVPG